ncbi:MAG: DUF1801 domain-containing protein [Caldilineaceae bacterium]|nr:DUF1801 domain-containing protein [Caldilineaceae bacterium]MDE0431518.1 DUF1801 domain-containing protein [Caldilineaceae bacterium]
MSEARLGSFEELLQMTEEPLRPVMEALRATVLAVDPDACEVVRLGDRAATYGVGPRKMLDGYTYLLPHKRWVNLGFYAGAELPDPEELLEGTGAKMRHVKIRTLQDTERAAVPALIRAALAHRKGETGP